MTRSWILSALAAIVATPAWAAAPAPTTTAGRISETRLPHISIVERGRGTPVILIPGNATPRTVWDGIAGGLARSHRLILVQLNGFDGDDPGANLRPGVLQGAVNDLADYLEKRHVPAAAIIGHSQGGFLALMMADQHPALLSKILLVDSRPSLATVLLPDVPPTDVPRRAAAMRDEIAERYGHPDRQGAAAEAQANRTALTPEGREEVFRYNVRADARVMAQTTYEALVDDLRPRLSAIKTPVTLLYPWNAPTMPEAKAASIYHAAFTGLPQLVYVPIPGAYHYLMLDQPRRFAAEVSVFLAN